MEFGVAHFGIGYIGADEVAAAVAVPHHGTGLGILCDVEHHWARASGIGYIESAGYGGGNILAASDLEIPFRDRLCDAHYVGFLEGVAAKKRGVDLTYDDHQRSGVDIGIAQTGDDVGGSWSGGHHHHAGAVACARISLGGVYGALLMAGEDMGYLVGIVVEGVVERDDGTSRIAEDAVDTFVDKSADNSLGACDGLAHREEWYFGVLCYEIC